MDINKIKVGKRVAYRTPRGSTGKGTVMTVNFKPGSGTWVAVYDKSRDKRIHVQPAMLSSV